MRKHKSLYFHLALLVGVFGVFTIVNFPYGKWFTGWDNLHPEFNFWLNFKRAMSAVWQENQGLGTYGGHGYAATLPHTLLLWLMSLVIPLLYLRSTFTFLMLLIGVLGVFFLVRRLIANADENVRNSAALFAGLYYMLNFATVQNFYIQLEAFIAQFAVLPWLFYLLFAFLSDPTSKRRLGIFAIVSFLASLQGFIPPLFFVYILLLSITLICYVLPRNRLARLKTATVVMIVTLLVNAYWFMPVAYYSFTRSDTYLNAYNNLSSTQDFILKNQKYGKIQDIAILRGFISEAIDASDNGAIFYIFQQWRDHLAQTLIIIIGYILFAVIMIGAASLIIMKHTYVKTALFLGMLLSFAFMATDMVPFSDLNQLLQYVPIFKQAFRVAFTKFSVSLAFFYAVAFGFGIAAIWQLLSRITPKYARGLKAGVGLLLFSGLILFAMPSFSGNFLYKRIQLTIPSMYFSLFDFFSKQPKDTRIANLPQGWNWGWSIYKWGYSGSGFLWYGIEQPIMDRAFDVWGKYNENYFWELSYAIYAENFVLFDSIIDKYAIDWLVVDRNVAPYLNPRGFFFSSALEKHLANTKRYTLVKAFTTTDAKLLPIKIYGVNRKEPVREFTIVINDKTSKNIGPAYDFTNYDRAFAQHGTYYTKPDAEYDAYYPFRTLLTNRRPQDFPVAVYQDDSIIRFSTTLPNDSWKYQMTVSAVESETYDATPSVSLQKQRIVVSVKKSQELYYDSREDQDFLTHRPSPCYAPTTQQGEFKQQLLLGNILEFTSVDAENCYDIILNQLPQRLSYLVTVESRHVEGKELQFAVINQESKKADIVYPLPDSPSFTTQFAVIPPMKFYGLGYSLSFNNISIGKSKTTNDVKQVTLYPIPFATLTGIRLERRQDKPKKRPFVVFYQSFDPGWHAYYIEKPNSLQRVFPFFFGKELKEHVLVNNWANGWLLDKPVETKTIVAVFFPQYIEYLGFAGLFSIFAWLIVLLIKARRFAWR